MTKVLFTGGRDHFTTDAKLDALAAKYKIDQVVHGNARGIDRCVDAWADKRGLIRHVYPARWKVDGNWGGPIRNGVMLRMEKPDFVIAFPGGTGTADMVRQAIEAGVEVIRRAK